MNELQSALSRLTGRQETLIKQKIELLGEIDTLSELIGHDDAVMHILNQLQEEYSTSSVELYSELLTSMVRGVIPDYQADIILEPKVYANKPALDIYAVSQGQKEPIDDQGGSVSNLLAAGLRFIGLALSSNRRIAILDESDCWLEGRLVPSFLSCIHDLCSRLGLQVIFVSHHQDALSEVGVAKVKLKKRDGITYVAGKEAATIEAAASPDKRVNADALEGVGLRYVKLQDYMAHEDSTITLEPGLTAIIGDNNVGKSVITRAFHDVLTNNRNPNRIRRTMSESCIRIGLEGGYELLWQLSVSGKSKTCKGSYALLDDEANVVEFSKDATIPPQWLHSALAMEPVNGLQMHIGHQKDPLFILNPAISRHKRAELIQLGTEYDRINTMIKTHRSNIKSYRAKLKAHQSSVEATNRSLAPLRGIEIINEAAMPVKYAASSALNSLEVFFELAGVDRSAQVHQVIEGALNLDIAEALKTNAELLTSMQRYAKSQQKNHHPLAQLQDALNISGQANDAVTGYEQKLRSIKQFAGARRGQAACSALSLLNEGLSEFTLGQSPETILAFIDAERSVEATQGELNATQQTLSTLEDELLAQGALCPTCKQPTEGTSHENRHH